jgi:hypothetical protein
MSFHSCYLSDYVCSYYLTFPPNMMGYSGSTFFPHLMLGYSYFACPMYAPCVKDGGCRYCGLNARHHRKYFLYSIMASKIQKCFLRYYFRTNIMKEICKRISYTKLSKTGEMLHIFLMKRFHFKVYRLRHHEHLMHIIRTSFFWVEN